MCGLICNVFNIAVFEAAIRVISMYTVSQKNKTPYSCR